MVNVFVHHSGHFPILMSELGGRRAVVGSVKQVRHDGLGLCLHS